MWTRIIYIGQNSFESSFEIGLDNFYVSFFYVKNGKNHKKTIKYSEKILVHALDILLTDIVNYTKIPIWGQENPEYTLSKWYFPLHTQILKIISLFKLLPFSVRDV